MLSLILSLAVSQLCIDNEGQRQFCGITTVKCRGALTCGAERTGIVVMFADAGTGGGGGGTSEGGACGANQFVHTINNGAGPTCSQVATSQLSGTVTNAQLASSYSGVGTCTNQFARTLNANAAPTCATVSLTADVAGTLAQGNGGTGTGALTCSAGDFITSNGTTYSCATPSGGGGGGTSPLSLLLGTP